MSTPSNIIAYDMLNLVTDGIDTYICMYAPQPTRVTPTIPIHVLCEAIATSLDSDWPIIDFNHKDNKWIIQPGVNVKRVGKYDYIFYKKSQLTCSTITKLFYQGGWEIDILAWEPALSRKNRKSATDGNSN